MEKVKPITQKLTGQQRIIRAIRLFEKKKDNLKLLIDALRTKKAGESKG
jgi:hypothetical protein